jgi:protein-tyrosine phosphatase
VHDNIEYLCIGDIAGSEDMAKHLDDLDQAVDFAESARKSGGKVLSHCWYGMNRSVSLLVAYLMKYENMTAKVQIISSSKLVPKRLHISMH